LSSFTGSATNFGSQLMEISKKWLIEWEKHGVNEANIDESKPKFFVTAAFPYTNGPLHLGHALTYSIPDVLIRYKRMKGYNVLFPMGFHFTGTPIISISESIARGDEKTIKRLLDDGVPIEVIESFVNPINLALYFKDRAINSLRNMLFMIDWRRSFTSVDKEFQKFVEWQFLKLRDAGYIVQGTHPVGWCPFHQSPVSMHDTLNDVEPEIQEFTLIFFRDEENIIYPVATLRPETVYGVTNLWVNPEATYVLVEVDGQRMLLSQEASYKLSFQKKEVKPLMSIKGSSLVGRKVVNPLTMEKIEVLPAGFVDPDTGTGIVMSVPAHAPFDYAALKEIGYENTLKPISIIDIDGKPSLLGVEVVNNQGIKTASKEEDRKKLEELTKDVYLREFNSGLMSRELSSRVSGEHIYLSIVKSIEGKPVKEAREYLKEAIIKMKLGDVFYEIANKPVYCRCGTKVVVKIVENQWFINYEDENWKKKVYDALRGIDIVPNDYREQFVNTVGWLKKKACARSRGLGTPLPWDKSWIIESLSDSTIYMAFYTVIHKIRMHGINPEKLTPEFWDYVMLGKGDVNRISASLGIDRGILEEIRKEFDYWYPLDNRHSGKDLIPNHLTFMVFNHVAIFPPEKWPKRIVVNGHIMVEGMKMSKSLGNFITIDKALKEVSPDVLRLSLILGAEIGNDVNYTKQLTTTVTETLEGIYELVVSVNSSRYITEENMSESTVFLEKTLETKLHRLLREINELMENYKFRSAAIKIYHEINNELKLHFKINGLYRSDLINRIIESWIKLMSPFTPAFSEELWHLTGHKSFVVNESWPDPSMFVKSDEHALFLKYIDTIVDDIGNLRNLFSDKKEVIIVASSSKPCYPAKAKGYLADNNQLRELTRLLAREGVPSPHDYARRIVAFLKNLTMDELNKIEKLCKYEGEILRKMSSYLEGLLNLKIEILSEEAPEAQEYIVKKKQSPLPMRPVIIFK